MYDGRTFCRREKRKKHSFTLVVNMDLHLAFLESDREEGLAQSVLVESDREEGLAHTVLVESDSRDAKCYDFFVILRFLTPITPITILDIKLRFSSISVFFKVNL